MPELTAAFEEAESVRAVCQAHAQKLLADGKCEDPDQAYEEVCFDCCAIATVSFVVLQVQKSVVQATQFLMRVAPSIESVQAHTQAAVRAAAMVRCFLLLFAELSGQRRRRRKSLGGVQASAKSRWSALRTLCMVLRHFR